MAERPHDGRRGVWRLHRKAHGINQAFLPRGLDLAAACDVIRKADVPRASDDVGDRVALRGRDRDRGLRPIGRRRYVVVLFVDDAPEVELLAAPGVASGRFAK
jgi:hypothetical protein